jgi:hypothetical protein
MNTTSTAAAATSTEIAAAKLAYKMGTHTIAQLRLIRRQFDIDSAAQRAEDEAAAYAADLAR